MNITLMINGTIRTFTDIAELNDTLSHTRISTAGNLVTKQPLLTAPKESAQPNDNSGSETRS